MTTAASRVLVVEDEPNVRKLLSVHLERERLQVTACANVTDARKVLSGSAFDLVILDWMLPDGAGIELCRELAASASPPPILMVTARSEPADIVLGLEMGADDYLTKPFEIPVFTARVRALLRRSRRQAAPAPTAKDALQVENLKVHESRVEVLCCEKEIQLTASEFRLLVALLKNQGRVLSRSQLMKLVQGDGTFVVDRVIDTHIYTLRTKLGDCSEFVETVRGIGYRVKG